ncbi:hypothetical protein L1987_24246 [Smallanthus sonchifolius]|uniref:Uncharacterized protein n=1 Tax=Smallanthus sonchifolius TaxID=185202 RepID=A0ACB9IJP7_9ASTR|nr:hypothetical protein L1987_24246 [Smallanthus sonchifolius]
MMRVGCLASSSKFNQQRDIKNRIWKYLPTKRNRRIKAIDREVNRSVRSIIDNRLKAMKAGEGNYHDLLVIILESNIKEVEQRQNKTYGMTINEVIEEHQEWQSCVREEVLNIFRDKDINVDGLNHLKVVTMIFYEVLRLYPPVAGVPRRVEKDMTLGGFSLPSRIQIGLPIMLIHYDEQLWGNDAKKFNPGRFSEGISKATKNQVIYFPFGWGPRICIGQNFALLEAKTVLAKILQRFSFEFSPSYVHV